MGIIKVSVIIPVYNVERYLKQCIDSVIQQTLKEIEIIIVNDGSTDNSRFILNSYSHDTRVKIIDKDNAGLGAARNTGLGYARGSYIYFLDSDDYIEINMLEKLYQIASDEFADIVQCGIRRFYDNSNREEFLFYNEEVLIRSYSSIEAVKKYLNYDIPGYVHNKIIKRDIFINHNINFPEGVYYEDMLPTLKMFLVSNKIVLYREALHHYRQRESSISHNIKEKNIIDYVQQVKDCMAYLENSSNNISEDLIVFNVINYLNAINWYIKYLKCVKKDIVSNYSRYFENFDINYSTLNVLKLKNLNRNYKIIYLLHKLNLYHIFIKWGVF